MTDLPATSVEFGRQGPGSRVSHRASSVERLTAPGRHPQFDTLNERQRSVALLVGRGWSNREISTHLGVSTKTIEYHLGRIYARLYLSSRRELRDAAQAAGAPPES